MSGPSGVSAGEGGSGGRALPGPGGHCGSVSLLKVISYGAPRERGAQRSEGELVALGHSPQDKVGPSCPDHEETGQ